MPHLTSHHLHLLTLCVVGQEVDDVGQEAVFVGLEVALVGQEVDDVGAGAGICEA